MYILRLSTGSKGEAVFIKRITIENGHMIIYYRLSSSPKEENKSTINLKDNYKGKVYISNKHFSTTVSVEDLYKLNIETKTNHGKVTYEAI
jgi:hypothetical protein